MAVSTWQRWRDYEWVEASKAGEPDLNVNDIQDLAMLEAYGFGDGEVIE
mgnify:CR=1 FL=1